MERVFTTTKSTVECYKIRDQKGLWADITIDANGKTGRLQIASDYGSWQHYWGSCGTTFKEFLISLGIDYVAHKFGEGNWFDLDKTIASLKNQIDEYTQYDTIDDLKNELLAELKILEEEVSCKDEFIHKMWDSPKLLEMSDQCPNLVTSISPQFKKFWDTLWQEFKRVLDAEKMQVA
jgi:hypothetical protein